MELCPGRWYEVLAGFQAAFVCIGFLCSSRLALRLLNCVVYSDV